MESNYDFELIAILLVSHGSGGPRLLFKYPFSHANNEKSLKNQGILVNRGFINKFYLYLNKIF